MSKAEDLRGILEGGDSLTIVCHNNPDPDCLSSALALGRIAASAGIDERRILYSGTVSHQQNRALVNALEIKLEPFDPESVRDRSQETLLAFVDHAIPGRNNEVPEGTPIDIVIDHHPADNIEARFVEHRPETGATATVLTEFVTALGVELDTNLATALLFAIRQETLGFLRGATTAEYQAGATLHDNSDRDLLRRLSNPSVSGVTVDAIADAIKNRSVRGSVLITTVGRTSERDALPQAADYLATLEGVETAIVFGITDGSIQISARSTDPRVDIGDVLENSFEGIGSAGGHREMAGGEVPMGIFAEYTSDDDQLVTIVEEVVTARLLAGLNLSDSGN
jgi:nanoRNase/pAp phosphatase (c-di-AMP/oligoRNAs hydrolase)